MTDVQPSCCFDTMIDTVVAERGAVIAFAKTFRAQTTALVALGRVPAAEVTLLNERIRAFADAIGTGLHRDGADPVRVRAAMRAIVQGAG